MHTGKPGSWSTWAYHSRRWSSHIWHTSEGTVRGVCLPISNSAMLRKTSHETSITFITTPNESRYPCISHMDHLTNMKNIQIIDEWVLSLADHMVVQYKKTLHASCWVKRSEWEKGYWIRFHSWEKGFFVRCLARSLSVAFYFQNFQISWSTEIHTQKTDFQFPHTCLLSEWRCNWFNECALFPNFP